MPFSAKIHFSNFQASWAVPNGGNMCQRGPMDELCEDKYAYFCSLSFQLKNQINLNCVYSYCRLNYFSNKLKIA